MERRSVTRPLGPLTWEGNLDSDSAGRSSPAEDESTASDGTSDSAWGAVVQRAFDVVLSSAGLLIGAPLLVLIAVAVKVDSPGSILYRQIRVGRDRRNRSSGESDDASRRTGDLGGRPFVIYKFRTMHEGAERGRGPTWAAEEDDRTTRIGGFLRKYRLDELPQLWNVLKGDMSIVGPRPERPQFVNELRDRIPGYQNRQRARPGITGWAQVNQKADQSVDDVRQKVRYDLEYLQNRSLLLDLSIILRTPVALLSEWTTGDDPDAGTDDGGGGRNRRAGEPGSGREGVGGMDTDGPGSERSSDRGSGDSSEGTPILLATSRRWLTAALEEVLAPEGFTLLRASDAESLLRKGEVSSPALVVVDEELPGMDVGEMAERLVSGGLGEDVPLLLYTSSSVAGADRHARALEKGFWDLLKEPVRARPVIAKFRRLICLSGRLGTATPRGGPTEMESVRSDGSSIGFLELDELVHVLPAIGALAEREKASVSLVLLGPTVGADDAGKRSATASLCGPNVRRADLCAWADGAEVVIVAYDTGAEGARTLFERLDRIAAARSDLRDEETLSAGIVELKPNRSLSRAVRRVGNRGEDETVEAERVVELFHLTDARGALDDARAAGGGARVVEIV